MKTVQVTSQAHFQCDACQSETATTPGPLPASWKEIRQRPSTAMAPITVKKHVCPECFASSDPAILAAIKALIA